MKTKLGALLLAVAVAGCDGNRVAVGPPDPPDVIEAILAALEAEGVPGPIALYDSLWNISNPDLVAELRKHLDPREEFTCEPGDRLCPRIDLEYPRVPDGYGSAIYFGDWKDGKLMVYRSHVIFADRLSVEVTRTDEGVWVVGDAELIGGVIR